MRKDYDVVIIGGGILGCATAWQLSRQAGLKIAIVERDMIGMQTTSLAAALVTLARPAMPQIRMVQETFRAIADLEGLLEESLDFNHVGSMNVAQSPDSADAIAQQAAMLQAAGEHVEILSVSEARAKAPWLDLQDANLILFNAKDGFVDPYRLASAYLRGAKEAVRRQGGVLDVLQSTNVTGFVADGSGPHQVYTDKGMLKAGAVIVAAGPWANHLLRPLGSRAAIAPIRSHYWITAADQRFPSNAPVTILPEARAYARPEVGGLLFGLRDCDNRWAHPGDLPDSLQGFAFDDDSDGWAALAATVDPFLALCPALGEVEIPHYISGPSGYTPDGYQVIGAAPGLASVYLASGCCGAGVALSGGIGLILADMVTGQDPSIDASAFDPGRFGIFDAHDEAFIQRCALSRSAKKAG